MNSPRNDRTPSHVYREGAWPEPNRQIEQAIRATARERRSFLRRWALPFALAAGALLAFALIIRPVQEQPRPVATPPPPANNSIIEQLPAAPDAHKAAVEKDAQYAAVKPQGAPASARATAPPSATSTPAFAPRRDEAERLRPLKSDAGVRPGSPASESPLPPPAAKAASRKEAPERAPATTFVTTRPPQAWIEDIRKLKAEGKTEEAALALAEFRRRNPDYVLPEDLR